MLNQLRTGDVYDPLKLTEPVVIVGCGALGSAVALQLAKLSIPLILYDDDDLEEHNLPNQLIYGIEDVGRKKARVLSEILKKMCGNVSVSAQVKRIEDGYHLQNKYVIMCVDSMKSRTSIYGSMIDRDGVLIDGRIGARDYTIYTIPRDSIRQIDLYRDTLFSDEEAVVDRAACGTILSIGATANAAASYMVWSFLDHLMERPFSNHIQGCVSPPSIRSWAWKTPKNEDEDDY